MPLPYPLVTSVASARTTTMRPALLIALATVILVSGCGKTEEPVMPQAADSLATPAAAAPQPSEEETAKLLATLPAPYNTADLENGQTQSAFCRACHTLTADGPDLTGPNLHGVFGRVAGTKPGYAYSDAVKMAGFTWDPAHLDQWLANPTTYMPGTKMTFIGMKGEKNRTDLIAYLKVQTSFTPGSPTAP